MTGSLIIFRTQLQPHNDFFQSRIPGPFPNTVQGAFYFIGTVFDCNQRICGGQTGVIMTMDTEQDLIIQIFQTVVDPFDQITKLLRYGITYRIRNIDDGCACPDDRFNGFPQVFKIRPGSVLGRILNFGQQRFGIPDRVNPHFKYSILRPVEFLFHMNVGSPQNNMD
ncbi:hypothetical protein SDC9_169628 [bioreactor metagenome]|uniref:Uncharacterized protein n=1 Tax=bioreactor metagenome TaxID=1076179 RepID=A0A645G6H7_9ZZZZ